MGKKRLYKSSSDKAICGVCGGIAEYFEMDSLVVRLVLVLFSLAYGSGLLFYIIAALVMPKRPDISERRFDSRPQSAQGAASYVVDGREYINRASAFPGGEGAGPASVEGDEENLSVEDAERLADKYAAFSAGSMASSGEVQAEEERRSYSGRETSEERNYQRDHGQESNRKGSRNRYIGGVLLIAAGILILLKKFLPWLDEATIVAICAVAAGLFVLLKKN